MPLENYILDIMEGRRKGRSLLRALSYLYRGGVALRNQAFDRDLIGSKSVDIPVVSIGNIVAGGTGKTPLVRLLAEELLKTLNVAIVSRGYRSQVEKTGETLKIDGQTSVSQCGDEPFWLAQKLSKAQVWVGKNRFKSAVLAYQSGADVIILDDGMQHRSLRRDFEVIVVDVEDPFGKGFFLPRGLLRDSPHCLVHADLIVVMDGSSETEAQLRKYTYAPIVFAKTHSEMSLQGKKVGVFCAIGRPQRFLKSVKSCGGEVVATYFKPDHDPFTVDELNAFADRSGADLLVCTEKDQVKLPTNFNCSLPVVALPSRLEIHQGREEWDKILTNIREYHDRRVSSSTS